MKLKPSIISHRIVLSLSALASVVKAYPGELIYGCAVTPKEWEGDYTPWSGNTKNAHSHLTFDDGPFIGDTEVILDVLKEYNTKATFFLLADNMNEDTRYIVDRIIDEGHMIGKYKKLCTSCVLYPIPMFSFLHLSSPLRHTLTHIGSHTNTHRNLQYGNQTVLEEEIVDAHNFFKEYLGFQPKIFRPPYGSIDDRSHKLLEEYGYSIVMWSSGCVDWWFTGNDKDLETSTPAMRYSQAEMGSIVCMHDTAQAPNKGERLRKYLDDTWDLWDYVDSPKQSAIA